MANNYLVVVDMQHDFVSGSLGTPEAQAIADRACAYARDFDGTVVFTKDTHEKNYLETQEGSNLPVIHCVRDTPGWKLIEGMERVRASRQAMVFEKPTFGSVQLVWWLAEENTAMPIDSIELIGLCTDICVVSNALLIKAHFPEIPVRVNASLCAGVSPALHDAALATMRSCQVDVYGGGQA